MIRKNPPAYTVMHDWWIYLIATSLGMLYYDEIPYIKYRQHNDNAFGNIDLSSCFQSVERSISRQKAFLTYMVNIWIQIREKQHSYWLPQRKIFF